jgi:hypothetical protein
VGLVGHHVGWSLRTWNGVLFIDVRSPWLGDVVQLAFAALVIACSAASYRYIETPGRIICNRIGSSLPFLSRRNRAGEIGATPLR